MVFLVRPQPIRKENSVVDNELEMQTHMKKQLTAMIRELFKTFNSLFVR